MRNIDLFVLLYALLYITHETVIASWVSVPLSILKDTGHLWYLSKSSHLVYLNIYMHKITNL